MGVSSLSQPVESFSFPSLTPYRRVLESELTILGGDCSHEGLF